MANDKVHHETDRLVDAFVERVNTRPRVRLGVHEVPEAVRLGPADERGRCDWQIRPSPGSTWLVDLQGRLPGRFPPSYLSLVQRYVFPAFDVGGVQLFSNTGAAGELEFSSAAFRDEALSRVLLREGFVPFGRLREHGEPVCFDLCGRVGGGECPVARMDQDEARLRGRAKILSRVADSFTALITA
jgi:hypothetical protein